VPWEQLLEAQTQVIGAFMPVLDGKYLARHPFDPAAPAESKYDAVTRATMIFDANTRVVNDPRGAMRTYFARNPTPATAGQED